MTTTIVLWTYIVLLVAGGVMGLLKAGSKISLGTSLAFALLLALVATHVWPLIYATWILGTLILFFGWRLTKSKKFMPAGLMVILSVSALALIHLL